MEWQPRTDAKMIIRKCRSPNSSACVGFIARVSRGTHRENSFLNEPSEGQAERLRPVALPSSVRAREAAEFAKGLEIVDALVARLRAHATDNDASVQGRS